MKMSIKPLNIADISERANMPIEEINSFIGLIKHSMEPFAKRIDVIENGIMRYYGVERRGIGVLKTE